MNKVIFFLIFISIGALSYGWWYNRSMIQKQHDTKLQTFIDAGPRFTAQDGNALCEALREVAKHSIGFQQSGKPLPDCNYGSK